MFGKLAEKARSAVSVPDVVEQNWAKCESFVVSAIADAYEENVVSDEGFSGVMESVYELLPLPLRLLLSRDRFLAISLSHRDTLMTKGRDYRQSKLSSGLIGHDSSVDIPPPAGIVEAIAHGS